MSSNPFTIGEVGEPGSLRAIADFSCPKCSRHTRFTPEDQDIDGGFTCPHCGLLVSITGARLSDYQAQLDAINASLSNFVGTVERKVGLAAREITEEAAEQVRDEGEPN